MFWKKKDEQYYIDKGRKCQKNEKYDEAIEDYTKAIELNPSEIDLYYFNIGYYFVFF